MHPAVVIVGLGEVGKPLLDIMKSRYQTFGVDINQPASISQCDVMHICFPFESDKFVGQVVEYIHHYRPALTIVNSTVAPGSTRRIAAESGAPVVHSPIRGKHARMQEELLHYTKFVGALDPQSGQHAVEHFEKIGMKTRLLTSPEATEIAKLAETTYFGLLIAWAQEVERYCAKLGVNYDDVVSIYDEIKFFPAVKYLPGVIGGHCVMPNIAILRQQFPSSLLGAIVESNTVKQKTLSSDESLGADRASFEVE